MSTSRMSPTKYGGVTLDLEKLHLPCDEEDELDLVHCPAAGAKKRTEPAGGVAVMMRR
jgi:hypothetical protein